jgi:hypothetical protein
MRTFICCALILALASGQVAAQPAPGPNHDPKHEEKIRARVANALDHHRFVAVETTDQRRFQGLVSEAESDHFVLALQGQTTTLTYAEVQRITWQQHVPRPIVAVAVATGVALALYGILNALLAKNG